MGFPQITQITPIRRKKKRKREEEKKNRQSASLIIALQQDPSSILFSIDLICEICVICG
jgi:hypothetical protein